MGQGPAGGTKVVIAPGTFQMGSVAVGGTALPVHPVKIHGMPVSSDTSLIKYRISKLSVPSRIKSQPSANAEMLV